MHAPATYTHTLVVGWTAKLEKLGTIALGASKGLLRAFVEGKLVWNAGNPVLSSSIRTKESKGELLENVHFSLLMNSPSFLPPSLSPFL